MLDTPQIIDTAAQAAAVLHLTVPRSEIQKVMGPGYLEVMAAVTAQGMTPSGPWFTHHFRMSPETFDFEIGIPVGPPIVAAGRVTPGQLPAARIARTVYQGPYEGLGSAWGEFEAWIKTEGLKPAPDLWERYLTGPESGDDPSSFRLFQLNAEGT